MKESNIRDLGVVKEFLIKEKRWLESFAGAYSDPFSGEDRYRQDEASQSIREELQKVIRENRFSNHMVVIAEK